MAGSQDKTEKPTSKKLSDARRRGQVARSQDLTTPFVLLFGGLAVFYSANLFWGHFQALVEELWGQGFVNAPASSFSRDFGMRMLSHFFFMILPSVGLMLVIAVGLNIVQTGGLLFSSEALQPKFSRLNPLQGIKKYISIRSFVELIKSILKILVVSYVAYTVVRDNRHLFLLMVDLETAEIIRIFGELSLKLLFKVFLIMAFVGLVDYLYQKWQHQKDLMMSKEEVKEEFKQTEGNPVIKSRIRSLQRAIARRRMMGQVRKADVVITNPTHYAVALEYKPGMEAPKVVARGADFLAKAIIKKAREHRVPVVQNAPLARALYNQVKLDASIPLSLYRAVAKVLAYVYQRQGKKPQ